LAVFKIFLLQFRKRHFDWYPTVHKSLHGFLHGIEWILFHGHLDYFQKLPLGGKHNIRLGDHGTPNAIWGPAWVLHWNHIRLRAWSHMTSHYTWGSMTALYEVGGGLGRSLDFFLRALTISWGQLLVCVWSGPKLVDSKSFEMNWPQP
jgi:hypothetical protein